MKKQNTDLKKAIGARVRRLRTAASITQSELAHMMGLTRVSIMNIEKGRHSCTIESIVGLKQYLKCDWSDIFPSEKECKVELKQISSIKNKEIAKKKKIKSLKEQIKKISQELKTK